MTCTRRSSKKGGVIVRHLVEKIGIIGLHIPATKVYEQLSMTVCR